MLKNISLKLSSTDPQKKNSKKSQNLKKNNPLQIQQKLNKLKAILQTDPLTKRTAKSSTLSNGSIVSRRNRNHTTVNDKSTQLSHRQKNIQVLNKSRQRHDKQNHQCKHEDIIKTKQIPKSEKFFIDSKQQQKKKSKQILSYFDSSSEFQQMQRRINKFKPSKSDTSGKLKLENQKSYYCQFDEDYVLQPEKIDSFSKLIESSYHEQHRRNVHSQQDLNSTQTLRQENFNNLKQNLNSSQSQQLATFTQPAQNPYNLAQIYHSPRNNTSKDLKQRKNVSCLSNYSNSYLKPIHEEKIWKGKVFKDQKSKNKNKLNSSKDKIKDKKSIVSFSFLLTRRSNKNNKKSLNFGDQLKYKSWINMKKSQVEKFDQKKKKNANNKSSDKKLKSKSGRKRANSGSLSRQKKNTSLNSVSYVNLNSIGKQNMSKYMNQSSSSLKKRSKQHKLTTRSRENVDKSVKLTNNESSKYLKKEKQLKSTKIQLLSSQIQFQKQEAIKQLHKKYEIEQLTLRLRQEIKKISSAMKNSSGKTNKFVTNNSMQNLRSDHKKNSSFKKKQSNNQKLESRQSFFHDKKTQNDISSSNIKIDDIVRLSNAKFAQNLSIEELISSKFKLIQQKYEQNHDYLKNQEDTNAYNPHILIFGEDSNKTNEKSVEKESNQEVQEDQYERSVKGQDARKEDSEIIQGIQKQQISEPELNRLVSQEEIIVIDKSEFDSPASNLDKSPLSNVNDSAKQISSSAQDQQQKSLFTKSKLFSTQCNIQQSQQPQNTTIQHQVQKTVISEERDKPNNLSEKYDTKMKDNNKSSQIQINDKLQDEILLQGQDEGFGFKNNEFQQFVRVYSELLIMCTHFWKVRDCIGQVGFMNRRKQNFKSQLTQNLSKPLGSSTISLLKMMRQAYGSQNQSKDSDDFNQDIEQTQSNHNYNSNQQQPQITQSNLLHQQQNNCSVQQNRLETCEQQPQGTGNEYIIPPDIYYEVESAIIEGLSCNNLYGADSYQQSLLGQSQEKSWIGSFDCFSRLLYLIRQMFQKTRAQVNLQAGCQNAQDETRQRQSIIMFYQDNVKCFSLAVFDLCNCILDELRPYGSKGLSPINFYRQGQQSLSQSTYNPYHQTNSHNNQPSLDSAIKLVSQKLRSQVLCIRLGLIQSNIQTVSTDKSKSSVASFASKPHPTLHCHNISQADNIIWSQRQQVNSEQKKAQVMGKMMRGFLDKQAKVINRQLEQEYQYLEDVRFQILYELWHEIQGEVLQLEIVEMVQMMGVSDCMA